MLHVHLNKAWWYSHKKNIKYLLLVICTVHLMNKTGRICCFLNVIFFLFYLKCYHCVRPVMSFIINCNCNTYGIWYFFQLKFQTLIKQILFNLLSLVKFVYQSSFWLVNSPFLSTHILFYLKYILTMVILLFSFD